MAKRTTEQRRAAGKKNAVTRTWPAHWDIAGALKNAQEAVTAAGGGDLLAREVKEPVARARKIAECLAPADMLMSAAIGLGVAPAELEAHRAAFRQIAEVAHRRLSIVGLRSGEAVDVDVSERMQDFMARFFGGKRKPRGEPEEEAGGA